MRGGIRKRGQHSWQFSVSSIDPDTGQRLQRWVTVRGSRHDAERERRDALDQAEDGVLPAPLELTLRSYLHDEWLPAVTSLSKRGRRLAPTTAGRYAGAVDHISRHIGSVPLVKLRKAHIERARDKLLAEGLAPQTVGDNLRVLSQALSKAVGDRLISINPVSLVDRPKGERRAVPVMEPALALRVLDASLGTAMEAPAALALGTGLRREEVLGLRWSDVVIDGDDRLLRVRQTITYARRIDGDPLHEGEPKTPKSRRSIPLPEFVAVALRHQLAEQSRRRKVLGPAWIDRDLVFDRGDGGPWLPASFSKAWARFSMKKGFPNLTFHGLRHGYATLQLAAGVQTEVVAKLMGHSSPHITQTLYQDVIKTLEIDAARKLDFLLATKELTPDGGVVDPREPSLIARPNTGT